MEESAQRIVNRILRDAKTEATKIVNEAQRSAEKLIENQRQSAYHNSEEEVSTLSKKAEGEADILRGRVIMDTKRKAGWMVLSEKERLVTSVLNEVKKRLNNLQKSEKYRNILEKMIVEAGTALGGGKLEVMLNENDSSASLKMSKLSKAIADKTGVKTQLKLSKQRINVAGVMVRTIDGRILMDNTFDATIKRREKELRFKIARILF